MEFLEIEVTPELAKKWLEKNDSNRKVDWRRVHIYAEALKKGLWQPNPEAISFYKNGTLRDGQHRLLAILESGVTVKLCVCFGVPNDSVICDNNKPRTLQNFCQMTGQEAALCSKTVASGVNALFAQYRSIVSDSVKLKFIEDKAPSLLYISRITGRKHSRLASRAPVFAAIFVAFHSGVDEKTLERFIDVLTSGFVNNESENAAIVLRNALLREKSGGRAVAEKTFRISIKAISDFDNGIPRRRWYTKLGTETLPYYESFGKEIIKPYI